MNLGKKMSAEFTGTFALVFVGSLSVDISGSLVGVALAHGLTLLVMVLAIGAIAGFFAAREPDWGFRVSPSGNWAHRFRLGLGRNDVQTDDSYRTT